MIPVRVADVRQVADAIKLYELRSPSSAALPPFTAGAHVDLYLENGLTRSYSLVNSQAERDRYLLAVALDRNSRGGSRYLHEAIVSGQVLSISEPRNSFALDESAEHNVLIAGGIGVTPLMSMIDRLEQIGRSWELHYCCRSRSAAPFSERLSDLGSRVRLRFDDECDGALLDIPQLVASAPAGAHFYCCGPAGMLGAFQSACATLDDTRVHFEFFAPRQAAATEGSYTVVLARSQLALQVEPGKTILETVLAAGIDVQHDCTQGICGTCETAVLEGVPDHRDEVLTESERRAGKTMMICCSGSKSARLVLDL